MGANQAIRESPHERDGRPSVSEWCGELADARDDWESVGDDWESIGETWAR